MRAALAALALAGCTTVGAGGQMQRDATGRAIWSFLIPGVGQFMNREVGKGALMMGINVANNVYLQSSETREEFHQRRPTAVTIGLAVGVWSAADAHGVAQRLNMEQPLGRMNRSTRAPSEPSSAPVTVCLDLLNKRLLAGASYRF